MLIVFNHEYCGCYTYWINDQYFDIYIYDGNFLHYIEYPCNGGLCIDPEHNLIAGNKKSGEIRIIRYLQ